MRFINRIYHNFIIFIGGHGIFYPTPSNLNYFWALLAFAICITYVKCLGELHLTSTEIPKEQIQLSAEEVVAKPMENEPKPLPGGGKKFPLGLFMMCTAVMVVVVLDIYFNLSGREG